MKLVNKLIIASLAAVILFGSFEINAPNVTSAYAYEELIHNYKTLEKYDTEFSDVVKIDLEYDKYTMYPNYVVNLSSSKKSIYPEADTDVKRSDRIAYGEKMQVFEKIANDDGDEFYIIKSRIDGEYQYGYIPVDEVSLREFKLDEMIDNVDTLTEVINNQTVVYVENYKNENGSAPRHDGKSSDEFGNRRGQAAAGYYDSTMDGDFRYVADGMLGVAEQTVTTTDIYTSPYVIMPDGTFADRDLEQEYEKVPSRYDDPEDMLEKMKEEFNTEFPLAIRTYIPDFDQSLWIDGKYLENEGNHFEEFTQCVVVDRKNQNIVVLEKDDDWKIISISYASTGKSGEFSIPTPLGYFMAIQKKSKFNYVQDGTDTIVGFAPSTIRFTAGGYLHGVPMNYYIDANGGRTAPTTYKESLSSLGTVPKSHMCVRNYTSHALFMYEWIDIGKCAVIVME